METADSDSSYESEPDMNIDRDMFRSQEEIRYDESVKQDWIVSHSILYGYHVYHS